MAAPRSTLDHHAPAHLHAPPPPPRRKNQQYDSKWCLPLTELSFQGPEEVEPLTVPQVPDEELDALKLKISHLRSELQKEKVFLLAAPPPPLLGGLKVSAPPLVLPESQQGSQGDGATQEEAV